MWFRNHSSSNLYSCRGEGNFEPEVTLVFWFMFLFVKFNPLILHLRKLGCKEVMLRASSVQIISQPVCLTQKFLALLHHIDSRITWGIL